MENMMKLRIGLLFLFGLMIHGVAHAEQPAFKEGLQYTLIEPAPPTREGDEVEVIEFFWYGCPHCNSLEPYIKSWLAKKPDNVRFVRIPARRHLRRHPQPQAEAEHAGRDGGFPRQ
jgi:thiol:disulfide interchange protein DsbA